MSILGHELVGRGAGRTIVLHDWFGDCRVWEPTRPYLTPERFTYAFADLRGYGRSRELAGRFNVAEAVADVLALADSLAWGKFALIGHSMSTIVAQRLAQVASQRVQKLVLVTPVSPSGMKLPDEMAEMSRKLALAPDDRRMIGAKMMWGDRLSDTWIKQKLAHWREAASPEAAAAYVDLWGRTNVAGEAQKVRMPMLLVTCDQDQPPFRQAAVEAWRNTYYPQAVVARLVDSGHYPMQEAPPLLATAIERFLGEDKA